jgi:hypothetical protein
MCLVIQGGFAQFITNNGIAISNSALLVTNGEWTNASGANLLNNGVIRTSNSFVNNGTLDRASLGGFVLDYATDLNFKLGGSSIGFVRKNGSGKALITGSVNVKDSLVLAGGILSMLNAIDTIALGSAAQLISADTFFIEGGFIARAGKGDLVFPFGKNGFYLPFKMYKVNAERVTAAIVDAPTGHTAGPGVDALIGFPYAWKVMEKVSSDTAAYVELNYPNHLPTVSNPIVVRQIPGSQYASMGARYIENSGTRTIVRSYSRRLNGLFMVGQGFPSDPVTDSLALVALYQSTGGDVWTNDANWLSGNVETWFGVTVNGQSITAVELPANNLRGSVADPLVDILSLQTVNLSANKLTGIPDFSLNTEISSLNVSNNNLDFVSLEPNSSVPGVNYLVQGNIGMAADTTIAVGSSYTFSIPQQTTNTQYLWKHDGVVVPGATAASLTLPSINRESMGSYVAEVSNPALPGLVLKSNVQRALAYAGVSGMLFADSNLPAQAGEVGLYRVQPGAFQLVKTLPVAADGSYAFEKVVLDDYQIRGFADTLVHERALPTYYQNTILWEEADTLILEDNVTNLDIVSQLEPGPPSGRGSISGYLQEDDGTGRLQETERNKRVARAGVSARRVENTGRTKGEILTLVAYVFTDENGEFTLPNLPQGNYRINFQYPGYPMDESSYTTVTIGSALESQVMVEASVVDGKINVRKLVVTGTYEAENYHAEVFPNPAVESLHLKFAGEVQSRAVTLTSLQGKVLYSANASDKDVALNVSHLQTGIYLLQITEGGRKVKTVKVSIE